MPLLIKTLDLATRHLPKVLSPEAHRNADYVLIGGFALGGLAYWRKDRPAAIASAVCAGSMLALNLATQYNGQPQNKMSFADHRRAELGLAALCSLIPRIWRTGRLAKAHFLVQAAVLVTLDNLTDATS